MRHQKTELGRQKFKEHNLALSQRQRSAFIMFDGQKDDAVIMLTLAATGFNQEDIQFLVQSGLIEPAIGADAVPSGFKGAAPEPSTSMPSESGLSDQDRYKLAYPIAVKLTSGLGFRGFKLNMSVESAGSYQELLAIAPKILDAVGNDKFTELYRALKG